MGPVVVAEFENTSRIILDLSFYWCQYKFEDTSKKYFLVYDFI